MGRRAGLTHHQGWEHHARSRASWSEPRTYGAQQLFGKQLTTWGKKKSGDLFIEACTGGIDAGGARASFTVAGLEGARQRRGRRDYIPKPCVRESLQKLRLVRRVLKKQKAKNRFRDCALILRKRWLVAKKMGQTFATMVKVLAHWWTGQSELARILSAPSHSQKKYWSDAARVAPEAAATTAGSRDRSAGGLCLAWAVAQYLRRSRALAPEAARLLSPGAPMPSAAHLDALHGAIATKKGLPPTSALAPPPPPPSSLGAVPRGVRLAARDLEASRRLRRCLAAVGFARRVAGALEARRRQTVEVRPLLDFRRGAASFLLGMHPVRQPH